MYLYLADLLAARTVLAEELELVNRSVPMDADKLRELASTLRLVEDRAREMALEIGASVARSHRARLAREAYLARRNDYNPLKPARFRVNPRKP